MPKLSRPLEEYDELHPVYCRACGRYLGQVFLDPRRVRMFCPEDVDPLCAVAREWVYDNDRDQEWLIHLAEVAEVPMSELGREWGMDRFRAHATIKNYYRRAQRSRV